MALTVTNEASVNSIVSGATLALTVTAAVGTMLVLAASADNAGAAGVASLSSTVTDSSGNTWINRNLLNRTSGVTNDGVTLGIWTCTVSVALVAGTVTVSFSPNTTAKAATIQKVTPAAGEMVLFVGAGAGATGGGTTFAAPTVSVTSGDTIFGFRALQSTTNGTADSDTTNGNWSSVYNAVATTGTISTSQGICSQYKTVNATGNQTFDTTSGSAREYAVNYIILSPLTVAFGSAGASAASFEFPVPTFSAGGVGSANFIALVSRTGIFRSAGRGTGRWLNATARPAGSRTRSIRILAKFDWTDEEIPTVRLWDGGGPWVDGSGDVWAGAGSFGDLEELEMAINGEATTLNLQMSGIGREGSDSIWLAYSMEQIIGSTVTILIQSCDLDDQPIGSPEIRFSGIIDDISFHDAVADRRPVSTVDVAVVNRFTVRRLTNGQVLSDADQRARSAILNPGAEPDMFCERVSGLQDINITWPRWND